LRQRVIFHEANFVTISYVKLRYIKSTHKKRDEKAKNAVLTVLYGI